MPVLRGGHLGKLSLKEIPVVKAGPRALRNSPARTCGLLSYTCVPMADISDRLLHAFSELEDIANEMTPEVASRSVEEPTLQLFWRRWPQVSSWAGSLWRLLNEDTVDPAAPASGEFDEVGGSG